MTHPSRVPGVTDLFVALGTGAAIGAALVATPALLGPGQGPAVGGPAWWLTLATVVLQAVALVWVAAFPRAVLVVVAVLAAAVACVAPTGIANLADAAVLVAVLRAALLRPPEALRVVLPLAGVLVAVNQAADGVGSGELEPTAALAGGVLQSLAIVALPAVVVLVVSERRQARLARGGELAAIDRERTALVRATVADERTAMARELHDIAAHHLSSIALMSAAIERQIDTDPPAAKQAIRQVRGQSRAMLDDLRRLVGLLREDAPDASVVESLQTVPDLVASVVSTGRTVHLRSTGDPAGRTGPLAQLVAYRMVQEALANAAVHAPGAACAVDLDGSRPDRVVVLVRNEPAPSAAPHPGGGFGLVGVRERAELVGGTFSAGPDDDGGWAARLEIPAEEREEAP